AIEAVELRRCPWRNSFHDLFRDLVLDREEIVHVPVEHIGPAHDPGLCVTQTRRYANGVAVLFNSSFENQNILIVRRSVLRVTCVHECHSAAWRDHAESSSTRQPSRESVGESLCEIRISCGLTDADKWKNRDNLRLRRRGCTCSGHSRRRDRTGG